jgi:hypothetical protein
LKEDSGRESHSNFYINNIYIFTRGEKKGERETELKKRKNYKSR